MSSEMHENKAQEQPKKNQIDLKSLGQVLRQSSPLYKNTMPVSLKVSFCNALTSVEMKISRKT